MNSEYVQFEKTGEGYQYESVASDRINYRSHPVLPNKVRVGNFKAFGSLQSVAIRPITLVFGSNSAGKSSLLHSLLLAKHILHTGDLDVIETVGSAGAVNLGGFDQFVHGNNQSLKVQLGVSIPVTAGQPLVVEGSPSSPAQTVFDAEFIRELSIDFSFGLIPNRPSAGLQPRTRMAVSPELYSVAANGEVVLTFEDLSYGWTEDDRGETKRPFVSKFQRGATMMQIKEFNLQHPATRRWLEREVTRCSTTRLTPVDWEFLAQSLDDLIANTWVESMHGGAIPTAVDWGHQHEVRPEDYADFRARPLAVPRKGTSRKDKLLRLVEILIARLVEVALKTAHVQLSGILHRIRYLKNVRVMPPREVGLPQEAGRDWDAAGGGAWNVLLDDVLIRQQVNRWLNDARFLSSPHSLEVQEFVNLDSSLKAIQRSMQRKPSRRKSKNPTADMERWRNALLGVAGSGASARMRRLVILDKLRSATVTHLDVGVGVSQVLPILVNAASTRHHIHLIEQPELHLHPGLQANLADVFIDSALGENKNAFLLETHSEHLILRILRRVRESTAGVANGLPPLRPEDVSVLYVQPGITGSEIIEMPITPDGDFDRPWPGGFFADRFNDLP